MLASGTAIPVAAPFVFCFALHIYLVRVALDVHLPLDVHLWVITREDSALMLPKALCPLEKQLVLSQFVLLICGLWRVGRSES